MYQYYSIVGLRKHWGVYPTNFTKKYTRNELPHGRPHSNALLKIIFSSLPRHFPEEEHEDLQK
jgi:hypothetical protein